MIIEYYRKPPEALAYDELTTSGLIGINIFLEIISSVWNLIYIYSDDMSVVAGTC